MPKRRADVQRNEKALLDAAAAAFVAAGVDAPVRDIAARAGVGVGTVYRHFPSRADLVVAVYRHQVEELARQGPEYLESEPTPYAALLRWVDGFVDFLITKHGLPGGDALLHKYFLDQLLPVCDELLAAAGIKDVRAFELMLAIGNLCIGPSDNDRYDARRMVGFLMAGLTA
ncbi:TetR/AcrR family transcriptional regulator [Kribbella jejuensis]|uniref:TetR family transcriptional regulator n=1 Tax=Kribbella jejuensis TaxID=236068 RepID=A0A542EAW6_9ACTN|nr:TetR/AcrR family transcriptional regulator [Kribbella jejuensis]TQJ12449.1 TetR family transcriptional regulator [Kribbella jejuensis]